MTAGRGFRAPPSRTLHVDAAENDRDHFGVDALVMSKAALEGLPAGERELVTRTGEAASRLLVERIRREDDAAHERLRSKMTVHDHG